MTYKQITAAELNDDDIIVNRGRIGAIGRVGVWIVMAVAEYVPSLATGKIEYVQHDLVLHETSQVVIELDDDEVMA